jgi:hypothetical protein
MPTLSIEKMTVKGKLEVMKEFWTDIPCEQDRIQVPQWHKEILDKREKLVMEGKARFVDMESAKKRIADRIS